MRAHQSVDMLHGPLLKKICQLAIPIFFASALQQLLNTADTAVSGRFISSDAMAAVGNNAPVIALFISLLIGLSMGANVRIALELGKRNFADIPQGVHTSMTFALIIGVLFMLLGQSAADPILTAIGTPEAVIPHARTYLYYYFYGIPFITLYNFGGAILRADGDSKRPLYALIVASIANLIMDLIFVCVFDLGIIGVAIATSIANAMSALLVIAFLVCDKGYLHLSLTDFQLAPHIISTIVRIGGPAGLQGVFFCFSNVVIQSAVNSFGAAATAGVSAALIFELCAFFVVNGFTQASITFTSQNFAARDFARCKKIFRLSLIASALLTLCLSAVFLLLRYPLLDIFTSDPIVMDYALTRFYMATAFGFIAAFYEVPAGCLRGMGISLLPAIEILFGSCILRIGFVLFILPTYHDFTLLSTIYPISWIVTGILVGTTYYIIQKKYLPA